MDLIYCIQNKEEKEKLDKYSPSGVTKRFFSLNQEQSLFVVFSALENTKASAKLLAGIDHFIITNYQVETIVNDSSAYFNKKLYSVFCVFERRMREFLYLFISTHPNEESLQTIKEMEKKDLGVLFTLLFIDGAFADKIKAKIKDRNKEYFSKAEVIDCINSVQEQPLWDKTIGKETVPTLRSQFQRVRQYRNDVMHCQNFSWQDYLEKKQLVTKINEELKTAIDQLIEHGIDRETAEVFTHTINLAMKTQEIFEGVGRLYAGIDKMTSLGAQLAQGFSTNGFSDRLQEIQASVAALYKPFHENPMQNRIKELNQSMEYFNKYRSELFQSAWDQRLKALEIETLGKVISQATMLNSPDIIKAQEIINQVTNPDNDKSKGQKEKQEPKRNKPDGQKGNNDTENDTENSK